MTLQDAHNGFIADEAAMDTLDYAKSLDEQDPLRHLRSQFIIPSKADLKSNTLSPPGTLTPTIPTQSLDTNPALDIRRR